MGCGATSGKKYEGSAAELNSLEDPPQETKLQLIDDADDEEDAPPRKIRGGSAARLAPPLTAMTQSESPTSDKADRYRASRRDVDIVEICDEDAELAMAVIQAKANDCNLLKKYANEGANKRKPTSCTHIFAPTSGFDSMSAPQRQKLSRGGSAQSDDEEHSTLRNHTVGGLKLQHQNWVGQVGKATK